MKSNSDLEKQLFSIDGKSYSLYQTLCDIYSFDNYILSIDHVQGDPFATPSKVRIIINQKTANFPEFTFNKKYKKGIVQLYEWNYSFFDNKSIHYIWKKSRVFVFNEGKL